LLHLEAINRAVPLSLPSPAHECRSASCSRIGLYFVCMEGAGLTWRDTAPIRRLTLVYPLPQHLPITLRSSLLLPLTSSFTVKVHTDIFFYSSDRGWMSKFTSTPGQPHRVAPTISPNGGTTKGLRPVCTKRTPRDSDTWRRKLCSVRYAHEKRRAAGQTCAQRTLPRLTLSPLERSARETKRIMKRSE